MTRSNTRRKYGVHRDRCGVPIRPDTMQIIDIDYYRRKTIRQCPECGETFESNYQPTDIFGTMHKRDEQKL